MTFTEQTTMILDENEKLRQENKEISDRYRDLSDRFDEISDKLERAEQYIEKLRKMVFGKKSEKTLPPDPNQLSLFDDVRRANAEEKAGPDAGEEDEVVRIIRPKKKPARQPLDTSTLPVDEYHIYPDGTTDGDGNLKDGYEELKSEVTDRLERVPAKFYIVRTIRHCVVRKSGRGADTEGRDILIAPLPLAPIHKCIAGASVLADIVIGKFMYHIPTHRQIRQYRECGFNANASTMNGWCEAAILSLEPLHDLLKRKVLSAGYIQVDESVVPVLRDDRHKAVRGYIWVVRDGVTREVVFHYDFGRRSGVAAGKLLGSYRGIIQSDGYNVYEQFEKRDGVTMTGCWAHARRKVYEAMDEDRTLATRALGYIAKLYKIESESDEAGLSVEERGAKRLRESVPVLDDFKQWLIDTEPTVLPKSRMGKAISYIRNNMPKLSRYVNDGRVNIDNNGVENSIRPLAIGRKNFLFCGNDAAACRAAIAYSLIGTCKAVGVDPRAWMEDVLRKIPYYERDGRDMTELLPSNWAKSTSTCAG